MSIQHKDKKGITILTIVVEYIVIVKEYHSSGESHFHLFIKLTNGLSKYFFIQVFRRVFFIYTGILINVRSVKNLKAYCSYMVKDSTINNIYFCNTNLKQWIRDCHHKKGLIIATIMEFSSLEDWKQHRIANHLLYCENIAFCNNIWNILEELYIKKDISSILSSFSKGNINQSNYFFSFEEFISILKFTLILSKLQKEVSLKSPLCFNKRTTLLIYGVPNTGKTQLFLFINQLIKPFTCCYLSGISGDIRSFSSKSLYFLGDDIISKGSKWSVSSLLDFTSSRHHLKSSKYGRVITIPYGIPCVMLINDPKLFLNTPRLNIRCFKVEFFISNISLPLQLNDVSFLLGYCNTILTSDSFSFSLYKELIYSTSIHRQSNELKAALLEYYTSFSIHFLLDSNTYITLTKIKVKYYRIIPMGMYSPSIFN